MKIQKYILLTDSLSGFIVGVGTLSLSANLSRLYGWGIEQIQFIGLANLLYGCYSGFLFYRFISGDRVLKEKIIILILANSLWAGHCFTQIWYMYSGSSFFGFLHLGLEGIYVLILAYLEAKFLLASFLYESKKYF